MDPVLTWNRDFHDKDLCNGSSIHWGWAVVYSSNMCNVSSIYWGWVVVYSRNLCVRSRVLTWWWLAGGDPRR